MNPVQFNDGFAAYSVVQRLADGTVGLLVETAGGGAKGYGAIAFYRFNIGELAASPAVSTNRPTVPSARRWTTE